MLRRRVGSSSIELDLSPTKKRETHTGARAQNIYF